MRPLAIGELADRLGGQALSVDPAVQVTGFATDSREVLAGDLFIAIRGERVDGHDFACAAIESGAAAVLAERDVDGPQVRVNDVAGALASMALSFRRDFRGPVIGITGSNGKTTTKELVRAALSPLGPVLATEGNRNTEWTAPLLWAEVDASTQAVVVEMSMRGPGQIAHLAAFSRPTIGLITNIGSAHIEKLGSREAILHAKAELFEALPADGVAVAPFALRAELAPFARCRMETFGEEEAATMRILDSAVGRLCLSYRGSTLEVAAPAPGRAMRLNAAAALLAAVEAGVSFEAAAGALANAELPEGRMSWSQIGEGRVCFDAYNASPESYRASLETFVEATQGERRILVVGEMRELGRWTESAHRDLAEPIRAAEPDEVWLVGEATSYTAAALCESGFPATQLRQDASLEAIGLRLAKLQSGEAALIKGSRALELERVLDLARQEAAPR